MVTIWVALGGGEEASNLAQGVPSSQSSSNDLV
jgi:hypothetical protein